MYVCRLIIAVLAPSPQDWVPSRVGMYIQQVRVPRGCNETTWGGEDDELNACSPCSPNRLIKYT